MPPLLPLAQVQPSKGLPEIIDGLARTPLSQVVMFVAVLTVLRVLIAPSLAKTPPHLRTGNFRMLRLANELLDAVVYAGVFVFLIIRPFGVQAFRIPSGSMWPTLYVDDFVVANKAIYRYSDPQRGDVVVFRPPVTAITDANGVDDEGQVKVDFIKRCIGVPGDVIELRDGLLFLNGKQAADPTKRYSDHPADQKSFHEVDASTVPKANFKLIDYNGKVIPLNYSQGAANTGGVYSDGKILSAADDSYQVSSQFRIPEEDQAKAIAAKPAKVPDGFYLMMGDNRDNSFDSRGWGLVPRASIIGRSEFKWLPLSRLGRTPAADVAGH